MTIEYDDKGKYYTSVVKKLPVPAVMQTVTHLVRGFVHVIQGERLKNELERDEKFLAVTDASILIRFFSPHLLWLFNAVRSFGSCLLMAGISRRIQTNDHS